jgi:hypothetical protein
MRMSLEQWFNNGWVNRHKSSSQEIANLFNIVERDLQDAETDELSADWKFGIAYNAALKLCTILISAEGFRPEKTLQHYRTLLALPLILGEDRKADAEYLDTCRAKRNTIEYDRAGIVSDVDAVELIEFTREFKKDVLKWLKQTHPELIG